jgi:dihydrofolate synthase / folylpolyglutamate synthase
MTYEQTLEFLFSQLPAYHRIGKAAYKVDLDNSIALDKCMGHPHHNFKSIHIAGTNGKGSVSHMVASVFQEAGYKTGLYTSPHLKDFRERIKINGEMINKEEVVRFVNQYSGNIKSIMPSFFEMTVAMAFEIFSRERVDIAIVETGLGGRLDSTNIITPELSVITNIGYDHMDILGNTLEEIATEKAGIIKKSIPVIISETMNETEKVFIARAKDTGSEIIFADQNFKCVLAESKDPSVERTYVITEISSGNNITGAISLAGDYQRKNIPAVWQIFKTLTGRFLFTEENIINGIRKVVRNTGLMGRWQILKHKPLNICDAGHNRDGLEYALNQIKRMRQSGLHIVIGFVNDKDLSLIMPLFPDDAVYYFTRASVPRALNEKVLMEIARSYGLKGKSYKDVKSAIRAANEAASDEDIVFIGGSIFIVADAL